MEVKDFEADDLVIGLKNNLEVYSWMQEIKKVRKIFNRRINNIQVCSE